MLDLDVGNIFILRGRLSIWEQNIEVDICCAQLKLRAKTKNNYYVHRFIWECYNGLVPVGLEIDHINDNRSDNRLCNLQ